MQQPPSGVALPLQVPGHRLENSQELSGFAEQLAKLLGFSLYIGKYVMRALHDERSAFPLSIGSPSPVCRRTYLVS